MKSYTTGRNYFGSLVNNTNSTILTLADQIANDRYRQICAMKDWPWLEKVRTLSTTASTQGINLPYDCDQVREVSVIPTGQTNRYVPKLSPSSAHWDWLNQNTITNDIPQWYFIRNGQILLYPTPASTANTVYITQKSRVIDLSVADYTTGGILTLASAGTSVTGTGTTFTASMAGRYIRINYSDTANKGDGLWYEISGYTSATVISLTRAYGGTAITAGNAAYTIGQMPLLPEAFHDTPWKAAVANYWELQGNPTRAAMYQGEYDKDVAILEKTWSNPTTDMVIDNGDDDRIINPNLTISY